jgi:peptidyl-prolyl cis-trans isomerase C
MRDAFLAFSLAVAGSTIGAAACKAPSSSAIEPSDGAAAGPSMGRPGRPDDSTQVLARVGERTITLGDYVAAIEHMDQFDRLRYQAPERRKDLLREMIDVMLLADEARDRGYDKEPVTEQAVREIVRDAVLKKARQSAPAPKDIAADEVSGYYEAHKADFHDPERRRVSAVVLPSAAAASSALDAAQKSVDGASAGSWGDLVRTHSVDPQAKANVPIDLAGDLGFVNPPGDTHGVNTRVPEEVRAAVFEVAKVGDVLPRVVKATSPDGHAQFYVVKLAAKADGHDRSLQEAERTIRVKLAQDKANAVEAQLIEDLRKQYPVVVDEGALARVKVDATGLDASAP